MLFDMQIHVYHHYCPDKSMDDVVHRLGALEKRVTAMHEEMKAALKEIDDETNSLSARVDAIAANLAEGMTKEQTLEAIAEAKAISARLKGIAADPNNPVPA